MQCVSLLATLAVSVALTTLAPPATAQTPGLYDLDTVREMRLYFQQPNYWQLMLNNYSSKTEIEADLKVDGITYKRVGVRFRGNTSYKRLPPSSEKRGFNIRLDSNIPGQDLYGYDHLNLNNGYHDPTFMREVVLYQIARRYMSAPKANFVKVYLNDNYWGIYINVQQPNKDMMDEWYRDGSGNRYRGFPSQFPFDRAALIWLGSTVAPYKTAYEFKKGDGTDLLKLITVLNQTPQNQLQTELPKIWSVDQGYWYCICMNVMLQTDSYIGTGKDHFLYHDPFHDIFHIFPFDVNENLGGEGFANPNLSPFYNTTNSKRPILSQTMQFARWKARYIAHYRTVVEQSFSWQEIGGLVTKYQKMIANDVAADTKKIYTTAQFTQNVTQDVRIGRTTIKGLKPLVEARRKYLDSVTELRTTRPTMSGLTLTPTAPQASQSPIVTATISNASQATLYYRAQGPFIELQMFDDGKHGDGQANDNVWGNSIPAHQPGTAVDYYVSATTSAGVMRFLPVKAEHGALSYRVQWPTGTSAIVINELVAKNTKGAKDEASEFEDWLELHNTSNQAVNVGGMYLTDKFYNATKW
ncbi:MAG: CotH kinase family protein, partial [Planctomycetota bacterium]